MSKEKNVDFSAPADFSFSLELFHLPSLISLFLLRLGEHALVIIH